jgi:flagellar motor switch protein FliG
MSSGRGRSAISGVRKVAILVTALGEEAAAVIYRQLPSADVQHITAEVASLDSVPPELAQQILEEYLQQSAAQQMVIQGGTDYAARLLQKAFGGENAGDLVRQASQAHSGAGKLDWLKNADRRQLVEFLEKENPQTKALILAQLEPRSASSILAALPDETRIDVVRRMAQLRYCSPDVIEIISKFLNQKLQRGVVMETKEAAGPLESVPELMNYLGSTNSRSILEAIERDDADLANEIRNLMFTFEDFVGVPETALRDWLASVDKKTLALALKGASEPVKEHIFKAMSSRAVEMLKEDMEVLGRVRAKDVAKAQQEAVAAARQLEAEGKIELQAEEDDEFVA